MLAMTRQGAQQIVDNLSATVGRRELMLGHSYQRLRAKGPVIVLNSDTVMTNVTGLSFLNVEMHARLWDSLLARNWDRGPHELELDLQSLHAGCSRTASTTPTTPRSPWRSSTASMPVRPAGRRGRHRCATRTWSTCNVRRPARRARSR